MRNLSNLVRLLAIFVCLVCFKIGTSGATEAEVLTPITSGILTRRYPRFLEVTGPEPEPKYFTVVRTLAFPQDPFFPRLVPTVFETRVPIVRPVVELPQPAASEVNLRFAPGPAVPLPYRFSRS
ncbi:unnamed protein product [Notodromas monacha]|uniref:Uncharacterized protein n=1 Tax=Notodromas monacha TaxID=399045 RepID=A0A7R9C0M6_9CRUS|nr:unnamed protein product [Notodromas monacha]CAG0925263.1 unnamed protein product [Notodromas monacha]